MAAKISATLGIIRAMDADESVELWVPLAPVPKGNSQRVVRRGRFTRVLPSARAESAQRALANYLRRSAPASPPTGPVRRDATYWLPVPKSWPKWKRDAARDGRYLPPGGGRQPDTGNFDKLLDDALEAAGWVANDGQIVGGHTAKLYAPLEPGYSIRITPLEQATRSSPGHRYDPPVRRYRATP